MATIDEMSSEPKKKHTRVPRRRKHAVGVCASCRKRHIKCDLARPTCSACKAVGVTCDGYDSELRWTSNPGRYPIRKSKSNGSGVIYTRRHLYSEKDRISMSVGLRSSLVPGSVDNSLQEIDGRSREPPFPGQGTFVGPFGFINLQPERELDHLELQRISEPVISLDELNPSENPTDSAIPGLDDLSLNLDTVEDCLNWPDLFNLEEMWPDLSQNVLQDTSFDNITQDLGPVGTDLALGIPQLDDSPDLDFSLGSIQVEDAELLLKRYQDTVISHSFSFPLIEKSPWEIVNVNAAVMTLSRIHYLGKERVTHAAMANLLALVAASAAHKAASARNSGDYNAAYWENIRVHGYTKAKSHLQESLKNETGHIKKAKYKDQFMAISAMLSFAILCDYQREAKVYLADSERLLRLRGLTKGVISRKKRMLHHVYTWNRILLESSYVLTRQESCRGMLTSCWCDTCEKEHGPDMACNLRPNPDMKLDQFLCLDEAPAEDTHDNGEGHDGISNDTYLENSKGDSKAMYRHLYGISEKWLSLVSQTTRLANLMDRMKNSKTSQDNGMLDSIEKRKSRIEDMIWELVSRDASKASSLSRTVNVNFSNSAEVDQVENAVEPRSYMVRTLNLGLLIFFYRRITGLNAQLLQPYVSGIVEALKGFEAACKVRGMDGPGSPWPAFMAGCEALSGPDREYLSSWIDNAFAVTEFKRFDTMKLCMKEVWKKQNASNRSGGASWVDVCREKEMYVMLS